jgi:hypothetical protein
MSSCSSHPINHLIPINHLMQSNQVVILDEPTSGMDPISRRATWDIIRTRWGQDAPFEKLPGSSFCVWLRFLCMRDLDLD